MSGIREESIRPEALKRELAEYLVRDKTRWLGGKDRWISVACPACAQEGPPAGIVVRDLPFTECAECGTVYQNPRPDRPTLARYYAEAESYGFWAEKIFPTTAQARRQTIAEPLARKLIEAATQYGTGRELAVEIGAGAGLFLEALRDTDHFRRYLAVEPTPSLAGILQEKNFEVQQSGWEAAELPRAQADVVCAFEVIEHLFCPRDFLKIMKSVLRPGGLLMLSCPNIRGFDFEVLGFDLAENFGLEHINMFHPESLTYLLENMGFEVLDTSTPGRLDADLVRKKVIEGSLDLIDQPFLRRVLIDEWKTLGGPFQEFLQKQGLSSNMVAIARKPV